MTSEQNAFIKKHSWAAIYTGITKGVPPSITLAQAILESGWGKHAICNNYFGIKSHNWGGETCNAQTFEYGSSGYYNINSDFRAYPTPTASFVDHAKFLKENSRYDSLFQLSRTDYKGWAHGLKAAGYATAPNYGTTLINVIESHNLDKYDRRIHYIIGTIIIFLLLISYTVHRTYFK